MNKQQMRKRLEAEAVRLTKKYGDKAGALGSERYEVDVVPTGSLALDYALGTGGWLLGHTYHLFGEPDIGKSSTLGHAAFCNAQRKGLTTGLIAVEPGFDGAWARKNGVDTDLLVVARPDDGQEAFDILYDWINGDVVDFIIFDSIGGVVNPREDKAEGVVQQGGASALITMGVRRVLMPTFKYGKGLIFLNQIRDDMKSKFGGVKPPGGRLLTHACDTWVHLRASSGKPPETRREIKLDGEPVVVGRNLTAHITRNKLSEGTGVKAKFWYNSMSTREYGPVGIDVAADVIATAMRTGVIKREGAYYTHEAFPQKYQGKDPVETFLLGNPEAVNKIRKQVLAVMREQVVLADNISPDLQAFDRAISED